MSENAKNNVQNTSEKMLGWMVKQTFSVTASGKKPGELKVRLMKQADYTFMHNADFETFQGEMEAAIPGSSWVVVRQKTVCLWYQGVIILTAKPAEKIVMRGAK